MWKEERVSETEKKRGRERRKEGEGEEGVGGRGKRERKRTGVKNKFCVGMQGQGCCLAIASTDSLCQALAEHILWHLIGLPSLV